MSDEYTNLLFLKMKNALSDFQIKIMMLETEVQIKDVKIAELTDNLNKFSVNKSNNKIKKEDI